MANKEGMNKQMEKGKGREQGSREGCCWKGGDAGCVPLPTLDWGSCHPAWHGGQCQGLRRARLVWGALIWNFCSIFPEGSQGGDAAFTPVRWGLFPLSFGAVSAGGKELSLCLVCDCHPQPLPGSWVPNLPGCRAAKHRGGW